MLSRKELALMAKTFEENTPTVNVLREVMGERQTQRAKWGEQNCSDFEWVSIMVEEVGEACKEANDLNFIAIDDATALPRLRAELLQVAAVAVAWVEAIDRRELKKQKD